MSRISRLLVCFVASLSTIGLAASALGQDKDTGPQVAAWAGKPLGVGKIVFPGAKGVEPLPDLRESKSRALYVATSRLEAKGRTLEPVASYLFLFRGDEPLTIELPGLLKKPLIVQPKTDEKEYRLEKSRWWEAFQQVLVQERADGDYPPVVQQYLLHMLARRFDLSAPSLEEPKAPFLPSEYLDLFTGAESVRLASQRNVLLANADKAEQATEPLPPSVNVRAVAIPDVKEDAPLEPIVGHVPRECFYIRCGRPANLAWLLGVLEGFGTNLDAMLYLRGVRPNHLSRLERQLALPLAELAAAEGEISDMAAIGGDALVQDGAAVGLLFEVPADSKFPQELVRIRQAAAEKSGASESFVIVGQERVSCFLGPGNRVRSFYAVDGRYHLVTTSQSLVRRYFEAGAGRDHLGGEKEFRWARSKQPLSRGDDVWVYLSDSFFREILSARYRIEMTRRARARGVLQLVRLAMHCAELEGIKVESIRDLIAKKFLPEGIATRSDRSWPQIRRAGANGPAQVVDFLRGGAGTFVPVPDVEIGQCTPSEVLAYNRFAGEYWGAWRRMDPVLVGIRREPVTEMKRERIAIDVLVTPYANQQYSFIEAFLRSSKKQISRPQSQISLLQGNVFHFDCMLGIRDQMHPVEVKGGKIHEPAPLSNFEYLWLAAAGDFGGLETFADSWSGDRSGPRDPEGYLPLSQSHGFGGIDKLWSLRKGNVEVIAPRKETAAEILPQIKLVDAQRPARLRLWIGDVRRSQFSEVIRAEAYLSACQASRSTSELCRMLATRLDLPDERVVPLAEEILGGSLACPLGGKFEPPSYRSSGRTWNEMAEINGVPAEFRVPALDAFAELSLDFDLDRTSLMSHIELELHQPPAADSPK